MEFDQHASSVTTASFENLVAMLPVINSKKSDSTTKSVESDSNSSFDNFLAMIPVIKSKRNLNLNATAKTKALDSSSRTEETCPFDEQTEGNSDSESSTIDTNGSREASRKQSPPATETSRRTPRKGRRKTNEGTDGSSVSVSTIIYKCDNKSTGSSRSRDRSKSGSYHTRMLPDRPHLDVARDTKRILEICYGSNETIGNNEESPVAEDDNEKKEDSPLKEKPKKKKKGKKMKKKKKTSKKVDKSEKQQTATRSDVGPLEENVEVMLNDSKREQEKLSSPPSPASLNTTPSPSSPSRKTGSPKRPSSFSKKKKKRIVIVRRNAAGKVIRRRIKGKGRDRVVRKEFFRKGKDAKIGLATIDEDFYDGLVGDSSDDDSQYESYQSGTDTDECFAEDPSAFAKSSGNSSSDNSICSDDDEFDSEDDADDDKDAIGNATSRSAREIENSTREDSEDNDFNVCSKSAREIKNRTLEYAEDEIVNDTGKSVREIKNGTHQGAEGSRNENPARKSSRKRKNGAQRTNSRTNEVSSANEVSSRESLQNVRVSANRTVPPNEAVADPTEITIDSALELLSISRNISLDSSDSTACTSTASAQNRRGSKSCCRKYRKYFCAGVTFVFFVAATTVMVVYFAFGYQTFDTKPIILLQPPTDPPDSLQRPSLRPSLQPLPSIFDPSTLTPTLAPSSVLDTLSTSCYMLDDKEETVTTEAEYAPEQFGLSSISNANAGYCGEGYITGLETAGSGFGFDSIEVYTAGYYRVAIRYNNADRTEKYLRLRIDDRDEGTFKLVPSGNETSWLIDGIDNILLREGQHSIRISVESVDNRKGPNVDWIALVLQETFPKFDYLADLVKQANGLTEVQIQEISTLEWMSSEDTIDWSTLTDTELIERFALIQIYHFSSGDSWKNKNQWLSEFHVCNWYGITCSKDMRVTDLMLDNNSLTGFLPKDLSLLTNLILISLDNNDLQGMFPAQIGKLTNLSTLTLHANFFSGVLPSDLGALENLKTIDLRANFLYGKIPEEMYSMVKLETLALGSNFLSGTLSTSVGELKALKDLDLQISQLSGTIPTELGELTLLTSLALGYNQFSGTIPRELGLLQNLTVLDVNSNKLTGFIPPELSLLEGTAIDYYGNDLVI